MKFSIFLINSAIPALLAFLLFANSGRKAPARLFLSAAMLNVAFVFFSTFQYISGNYNLYIHIHSVGVAALLFVYPSFYQYLLLLTGSKHIRWRLFLPGILFGVISAVLFFGFLTRAERIYFMSTYRIDKEFDSLWLQVNSVFRLLNIGLIVFQVIYYYLLSVRLLKRYNEVIANTFSNPWEVNLDRVKIINYSFIVAGVACLGFYVINPAKLFGSSEVLSYPFYLLSLVVSVLGAMGLSQREAPQTFDSPRAMAEALPFPDEESTGGDQMLMGKLNGYFATQSPYLNPELTILQVAAELGTNRTYLSNCINRVTNQNFSQFVNTHRINHAKRAMLASKSLTLDRVATESGFGSTASLIRTFKELEGVTPSEFKKRSKSADSSLR